MSTHRRSHEPIFWSLFGAGGVLSAMLAPALVVVTGIAVPLGLLPAGALAYERMLAFVGHPIGKLALLAVISLTLWHAMHRVCHGLHDLGVRRAPLARKLATYGSAAIGTLLTAYLLISVGG